MAERSSVSTAIFDVSFFGSVLLRPSIDNFCSSFYSSFRGYVGNLFVALASTFAAVRSAPAHEQSHSEKDQTSIALSMNIVFSMSIVFSVSFLSVHLGIGANFQIEWLEFSWRRVEPKSAARGLPNAESREAELAGRVKKECLPAWPFLTCADVSCVAISAVISLK